MNNIFKYRKDIYLDNYLLIKNFDIVLKSGKKSAIVLGKSGSGKTSTLKSIRKSFRRDKLVRVFLNEEKKIEEFSYDKSDEYITKFLKNKKNIDLKINLINTILNRPKYLLLDDLSSKLSLEELRLLFFIMKKYNVSYVYFTTKTDFMFDFDYCYVIALKCIAMEGSPKSFWKEEKLFNKLGFEFPFYPSLSKKLILYDVLSNVCYDASSLEGALWPGK